MKTILLIFCAIGSITFGCSQTDSDQSNLKRLENLMNKYVSELNDVTHYTLRIKNKILDKETHLSSGESHHKKFRLNDSEFEMIQREIEPGAREFFDFVKYWDIHIDGSWIATEIYNKKDAKRLVDLLIQLQKELK